MNSHDLRKTALAKNNQWPQNFSQHHKKSQQLGNGFWTLCTISATVTKSARTMPCSQMKSMTCLKQQWLCNILPKSLTKIWWHFNNCEAFPTFSRQDWQPLNHLATALQCWSESFCSIWPKTEQQHKCLWMFQNEFRKSCRNLAMTTWWFCNDNWLRNACKTVLRFPAFAFCWRLQIQNIGKGRCQSTILAL